VQIVDTETVRCRKVFGVVELNMKSAARLARLERLLYPSSVQVPIKLNFSVSAPKSKRKRRYNLSK
jgi:hypothetical protein